MSTSRSLAMHQGLNDYRVLMSPDSQTVWSECMLLTSNEKTDMQHLHT